MVPIISRTLMKWVRPNEMLIQASGRRIGTDHHLKILPMSHGIRPKRVMNAATAAAPTLARIARKVIK